MQIGEHNDDAAQAMHDSEWSHDMHAGLDLQVPGPLRARVRSIICWPILDHLTDAFFNPITTRLLGQEPD